MKLRYIITALVAALTLVGCSKEIQLHLDEVQVSSSYVFIPIEGGTMSITVSATDSWTINNIPSWMTVSPTSGNAGETKVTFSADETLDGRSGSMNLVCAGKTQILNYIQGLPIVSKATCAEVIAGPDSKSYLVTGVCTAIANTSYGNFYLNDGTGEIYIYGTVNASGSYAWSSFGIEVGDEVTVQGPKTTYSGTVELVDATFVSVNKSLIKVAAVDPEDGTLPIEGGDVTYTLTNKGNGIQVSVPEDAKDWLTISSINGNNVTFTAAENKGGDRSTTITFKTTSGSKTYTAEATLAQKGAIVEVSVAEFNEKEVGDTQYRIKGIITKISNADKGQFYISDYSGEVYVYNMSDFASLEAKVGDIVTLVGKRAQYKTTIEMTSAYKEEHIKVEAKSIADFKALSDSKTDYYLISGTIVEATESGTKNDVATYGNFNLKDETGEIYVYGVYKGWNTTKKGEFGDLKLTWGDKITIVAYKTSYKDLNEAVGYYVSSEKAPQ